MRTLGDFSAVLEALPQWSKLSQIHKIELQVISDILIISVWTSAGMSQKAYTREYLASVHSMLKLLESWPIGGEE